ncbi:MAG: phage major capsid protein [Ruminococcus sp.]|nr:phage major capsid protein [Ruminococcus sp.]
MKKLIEKRTALKAKLSAMFDSIRTEDRAFTEDENKTFEELENEIKALDKTIRAEERAKNITDFHAPVADKQPDKSEIEERAFLDFLNGRITEMRAGEQNVTMSNNAAVIPETIANRIIDEVKDICPILANADVYHVKGTLKLPKWTKANSKHDITVGYSQEFSELTADSGKFISVDLGGYLAGALVLVGKSVMNNAAVNVSSFVIRKIAEKVAEFLEHELLAGTGSNAAQGALNSANTVTAGSKNALVLSDLIKLQSSVKQAFQKNACWTMNPATFTAIKLLTDNDGRPLIQPDVTKEFPYVLLGKPVYLSDNMPAVAPSAKAVLYGDYNGLSVNFREDIGIEILRENYHTQHAVGIDCWFEFDSKVTDEQKLAVLVMAAS